MKKLYYTISEASSISGVKPHVLRYWETLFSELKPAKNKAGKRTYTEKDIEVILRLKELIREKKFSTAGAKKEFKNSKNEDKQAHLPVAVQRELHEIRHFLSELHQKL